MHLIFIYNADSGRWNALLDSLHKSLFPQSYACHLCRITHNFWGEKEIWAKFRERFEGEISVFHKDQIPPELRNEATELPVILVDRPGGRQTLLSREEIARCGTAEALIAAIQQRLDLPPA